MKDSGVILVLTLHNPVFDYFPVMACPVVCPSSNSVFMLIQNYYYSLRRRNIRRRVGIFFVSS